MLFSTWLKSGSAPAALSYESFGAGLQRRDAPQLAGDAGARHARDGVGDLERGLPRLHLRGELVVHGLQLGVEVADVAVRRLVGGHGGRSTRVHGQIIAFPEIRGSREKVTERTSLSSKSTTCE